MATAAPWGPQVVLLPWLLSSCIGAGARQAPAGYPQGHLPAPEEDTAAVAVCTSAAHTGTVAQAPRGHSTLRAIRCQTCAQRPSLVCMLK